MSNAKVAVSLESIYAQTIDEIVEGLLVNGSKVTTLVRGHMGSGKSSILKMLAEKLPNHIPCYFDCTTKDLGDLMIPKILDIGDDTQFVRFVPNEELGFHHNKPVILMVDEFGKANPSVKNGMMRVMLERTHGSKKLHPESIIFATTNLGGEGVGDLLLPHHRNRITVVQMKKATTTEWIENYAYNAGIHPAMIMWVKDNEQLGQSYEDVPNPADNPYIYHPAVQRTSFFTWRSAELASHWLWAKDKISNNTLMGALVGTIGDRSASDLKAFITLVDDLPKQQEIKDSPETARVPSKASAVMMTVHKALATIDKTWIDSWMVYLNRLDKEAQQVFVGQVRNPKYTKQSMVMGNAKFRDWCVENNYMFTADKV